MTRRLRPQGGFTLIEVMVAILLMAIISLISWRGLESITRANERIDHSSDESEALLRVLRQIERDISLHAGAEIPAELDQNGLATRTSNTRSTSTLLPPTLRIDRQVQIPLRIEIIRGASATPGRWQRIRWWQEGGTLYRATGAPSDSLPLPPPIRSDAVAVLKDVETFEVQAWRAKQGWVPLPASDGRSTTALALDIQITQRMEQQIRRYRKVVVFQ